MKVFTFEWIRRMIFKCLIYTLEIGKYTHVVDVKHIVMGRFNRTDPSRGPRRIKLRETCSSKRWVSHRTYQ